MFTSPSYITVYRKAQQCGCLIAWALLFFCGIFFFSATVTAQSNELHFKSFTTDDGLAQNSGYDISQTPEGFMWFATQNGLDRYDGQSLKHYTANDSIPYSLPENQIFRLLTDDAGLLWISTRNHGIRIYKPKEDKFYTLSQLYGTDSSFGKVFIKRMQKDSKSVVWLMSATQGLYSFDGRTKQLRRWLNYGADDGHLTGLAVTENGEISVSDGKEIFIFNGTGFEPFGLRERLGLSPAGQTAPANISEFVFLKGECWVAGNGTGLYRINASAGGHLIEHITAASKDRPPGFSEPACLLKDREKNLWVCTANYGVFQYNSISGNIKNGRHDAEDHFSLRNNSVVSAFEDRQGITWLGLNGGGIAKYDEVKSFFRHISLANVASENAACALYSPDGQAFYIGTWAAGIITAEKDFSIFHNYYHRNNDPSSPPGNEVRSFTTDAGGNTWVATDEGLCEMNRGNKASFTSYFSGDTAIAHKNFCSVAALLYKNALLVSGSTGLGMFDPVAKKWLPLYDPAGFTKDKTITAFAIVENSHAADSVMAPKGTVWLATETTGLISYNYLSGIFTPYPAVAAICKTVRHILLKDNHIWIATDNGLLCSGIVPGPVTRYTDEEGLPGKVAYAMLADKSGHLWISTNSGVSRFDIATKKFINYPAGAGARGAEFNTAACGTDDKGRMYFGAVGGIYGFDPAQAPADHYTPGVLITGIDVMNKPLATAANISYTGAFCFDHDQNFISFHFAAPDYFEPEKITYQCMLEGIDRQWVNTGTRNFAGYTDLAPGKYRFFVKAANSNGIWSKSITTIELEILPPWWLTWWWETIAAAIVILLLYLFYRMRMNKVKRAAVIDRRMAEYELKALHSQMNPHFVFNCLGSIKQMVQDADKDGAGKYLGKFARLIRLTLEHSARSFISLAENNEYLNVYIEMEQLRFKNGFDYILRTPGIADPAAIMLPPLMIQPLVENAIWHGLKNNAKPGRLTIQFSVTENMLVCEVADNGPGLQRSQAEKEKHQSMSTDNIRRRLELLNKKYRYRSRLVISNGENEGVVSRLELPFIC